MWQLFQFVCADRDMLPRNVIHRHSEYLKLKEYEKWHVQGLSDLPPETSHKTVLLEVLSFTQREGGPLSPNIKGHREQSE